MTTDMTLTKVNTILDEVKNDLNTSPSTETLKKLFGNKEGVLRLLLNKSSKFKKGGFYRQMGMLAEEYKNLKFESMLPELEASEDKFENYKMKLQKNIKNIQEVSKLAQELHLDLDDNFTLTTEMFKMKNTRNPLNWIPNFCRTISIALKNKKRWVLETEDEGNLNEILYTLKKMDATFDKMKEFEQNYKFYLKMYNKVLKKKGQWKATEEKLKTFFEKCSDQAEKYIKSKEKDNKTIIGKLSKYVNNNKELDEAKMAFCKILKTLSENAGNSPLNYFSISDPSSSEFIPQYLK